MTTFSSPAVEVRGLRMSYGDVDVLTGVDLRIEPGEVVVLLGPNGAGKTTTIEILEGFRAPSSGTVRVLGVNPLTAGEFWRARVGIVLQSWRDHPKWRVRELLHHFGEFYRPYATPECPKPWDVDDLLRRVGLADKVNARISTLSGGQRRRLDVAVGLVGRPDILFLDEPTAGFDPAARRDFHDLVRSVADTGVTVLFTTHDLTEAEKLADRVVILAGGVIAADDTPDALRLSLSRTSEVRFTRDGVTEVHACHDPAAFLRDALNTPDAVTDLEVRRADLEDFYLDLVDRAPGRPLHVVEGRRSHHAKETA